MKNHIWVVERQSKSGLYAPYGCYMSRESARGNAQYFNGFAKGKNKPYRVRKYVEVKE
jgi:NADH:ubiquinone oxidoreductase subunit D